MSIFNYQEQPGYFKRLKEALQTTKDDLGHKMNQVMGTAESPVTEDQLEELENILISADIGVQTTLEIVEKMREETRGQRVVTRQRAKRMLRKEMLEILQASQDSPRKSASPSPPHVVFVVGVNGVGKTTTVGKLAHRLNQDEKSVLVCASDTFRSIRLAL